MHPSHCMTRAARVWLGLRGSETEGRRPVACYGGATVHSQASLPTASPRSSRLEDGLLCRPRRPIFTSQRRALSLARLSSTTSQRPLSLLGNRHASPQPDSRRAGRSAAPTNLPLHHGCAAATLQELKLAGCTLYHFAIEQWLGAFGTYAILVYDRDSTLTGDANRTFYLSTLQSGLYAATQCVGAIFMAPLVRRVHFRYLMASGAAIMSIMAIAVIALDAATGGRGPSGGEDGNSGEPLGHPSAGALITLYAIAGLGFGILELGNRTISRDLVGPDPVTLRRLDAVINICASAGGIAGAFSSTSIILSAGSNRALILAPACWVSALVAWMIMGNLK